MPTGYGKGAPRIVVFPFLSVTLQNRFEPAITCAWQMARHSISCWLGSVMFPEACAKAHVSRHGPYTPVATGLSARISRSASDISSTPSATSSHPRHISRLGIPCPLAFIALPVTAPQSSPLANSGGSGAERMICAHMPDSAARGISSSSATVALSDWEDEEEVRDSLTNGFGGLYGTGSSPHTSFAVCE